MSCQERESQPVKRIVGKVVEGPGHNVVMLPQSLKRFLIQFCMKYCLLCLSRVIIRSKTLTYDELYHFIIIVLNIYFAYFLAYLFDCIPFITATCFMCRH